ncbi:hypothetical protein L3Q82_011293 [Scortum barcoo]|uniref:Uncharacterized protein n=1 Tax=Scortum barcoo TaxID=214431 RepID=A0ACB8WB68_9TELE|nr:hypothetical protein L3Q82_011293 [Scortum barcoo]
MVRYTDRITNCGRCTNLPVNLTLDLSLTREQDPEILELLHLRQDLSTHLERACHPFPVENHGPRIWRTTSSAKSRDEILWFPNRTPSGPWLRLEILSIKIMNRTGDKGQPCRSPTCTGNRSDLLPAMQTKLLLRSYRDRTALSKGSRTPYSHGAPPTEYHEGHGRMPSPDPQSTCGLVGQTPINPQAPCGGYIELVQCSTTRATKTALFLLNPRVDYRPNSPLQYPGVDLPGEAEKCDSPCSWNTLSGPPF